MTDLLLNIVLLLICFPCVILHLIGIYLISLTLKREGENVQQLYIMYLSVSEVGLAGSRFVNILARLAATSSNHSSEIIKSIDSHVENINFTLFSVMYYSAMLLITIDRLIATCLTVMYPVYWSMRKAGYAIIVTTALGILTFIVLEICHHYGNIANISWLFTSCFYLPCDCVFVVVAVTAYTIIFHRYSASVRKRASTAASTMSTKNISKPNTLDILRSSRFYVSALLILTFVVFVVFVDIVYVVRHHKKNGDISRNHIIGFRIFYTTSFLIDGMIYVFLQPQLRGLLGSLSGRICRRRGSTITPAVNLNRRVRRKRDLEMSPAVVSRKRHSIMTS